MKVTHATVEAIAQNANAAVTNEQITRHRVEMVEAVLRRNFWGRLRWLLWGE